MRYQILYSNETANSYTIREIPDVITSDGGGRVFTVAIGEIFGEKGK